MGVTRPHLGASAKGSQTIQDGDQEHPTFPSPCTEAELGQFPHGDLCGRHEDDIS